MTQEEIFQLNLTREEARHILHALKRTLARNQHGDLESILDTVDKIEAELFNKIYNNDKK